MISPASDRAFRHTTVPTSEQHVFTTVKDNQTSVKILVRNRSNFEMLEVRYDQAVKDPAAAVKATNAFLGGRLDEAAMRAAIDAELYRNRRE